MEQMLGEVFGRDSYKVFNLLDVIDKTDSGIVTFKEFFDAVRKHPQILRPAFQFQQALQKGTLGSVKAWRAIAKRILDGDSVMIKVDPGAH